MHASFFTARLVALAAIASVVSGQGLPAGCDRNATVQSGDTCDAISARDNVSTWRQSTAELLTPVAIICLSERVLCLGISGQDCNVTYVMQTGDTCQSVANAAGIPINTLLANNPNVNTNCTNAYPGEVLCTASQIYVNTTQ
ncbi:hypothetical protein DFJ58DRAFT_727870 [Suillus subalutaceus]|uniref:uncharacterized protein n=1 Tax=Suillus subalutaceus TaxID=48586 RepID=UPI001B85BBFC|nr:uncharacterized protein DFJ58DRAFT_727870 [Suillus subalutaceus]KAG1854440.1 hypothetical protein DFJ58DRAFT_727870 [Suillus subalutaceus]